jgi:dynein heavy chain
MIKAPLRPQVEPTKPQNTESGRRTLPDDNTWLWEAFASIRKNLERAIEPLEGYLQTFRTFSEDNGLNPDKYVRSLDDGDQPISAEALRADIEVHRGEEDRLKGQIPETITVSIFEINCRDIRAAYVGKHSQIVDKEIKLIAQRAKEMNYELSTKFGEINEKIRKPPKNIEELTETRRFIQEIPSTIEKLRGEIDACMGVYEILDEFNFEFSSMDMDQKWKLFGAPKEIVEIIESQTQVLEKQKEAFVKAMEEEQIDFQDGLENLENTVGGFHIYSDLGKYEEIAENVDNVNQRLKECIEQARVYN